MPDPLFQPRLGLPFIELQSVDSTNNYALQRIHAGLAQHGAAFFTHEQYAGKGQRGKTWLAERDSSLIITIVINPEPLVLAHQFHLNACVAMSCCEFFQQYAGDSTRIKWPNDLYWQDRKAGGILIENIVRREMAAGSQEPGVGSREQGMAKWQWAVVGMGININQAAFPRGLKNPVSLRQITGKEFNTMELARELCHILDKNFTRLCNEGFNDIYEFYLSHLYKKGEPARLRKGSRTFEALIKGVNPAGKLVVQHAMEEEFVSGEVEWV